MHSGHTPKFTLNIHVTLEFFMVVSEFFVKFVILWPIAARFVWLNLKVGATGCNSLCNHPRYIYTVPFLRACELGSVIVNRN